MSLNRRRCPVRGQDEFRHIAERFRLRDLVTASIRINAHCNPLIYAPLGNFSSRNIRVAFAY